MKLQKEDGYYYLMQDGNDIAIATTDQSFIDELGAMKLSKENCDEIFCNKPAIQNPLNEYIKARHTQEECIGFIDGFNKAMELNKDKLFTVEDVKKAIYMSNHVRYAAFSIDEIIQSLQQPTEIDVEIEMENYGYCEGCRKAGMWHCAHADTCGYSETRERQKLDENGCLILKKK